MTVLACCGVCPAQAPLIPVTVCEVLSDLSSNQGREFAVLGRYSYRESNGLMLSEQACAATIAVAPQLKLKESPSAPKPPDGFELNGAELAKKFNDLRKRTSLGKFRFGTPDYDRWAVVYGRLETASGGSADLAFRGDGVVIFLNPDR